LQWGLRDPRKKRLTPLIELGEEFLGTLARHGMRSDPDTARRSTTLL
jgi:hypothetical protein